MRLVTLAELRPRIGVALTAQVLERVGRGDGAEPRTDDVVRAMRHALHEAATKCVTDAGRIDDAVRWNRRYVEGAILLVDGATVLAARDDERSRPR